MKDREKPYPTSKRLSDAYRSDPSVENYLLLRRQHPADAIDIRISSDLDHVRYNQEYLDEIGISKDDFVAIVDADQDAVSKVCLHLIESIVYARALTKEGAKHLAGRKRKIPDQAINWIICVIMDFASRRGSLHLNRDLIVLIRHQLMAGHSKVEKRLESKRLAEDATFVGAQLIVRGQAPSFRAVAAVLGVDAATIHRKFGGEKQFKSACERKMHLFQAGGKFERVMRNYSELFYVKPSSLS